MIKCVVIDDEQAAIDVLINYIRRVSDLELVGTSTDPIKGFDLIKSTNPDVIFLDIQMDELSGIELMSMLSHEIQVIFCTAFSDFAVESYDLEALDYLMKPIPFDRFMKAVKKIRKFPSSSEKIGPDEIADDYIYVKTESKGKILRVNFVDIDFVEAKNNYIAFHCGKKIIMVYSTMNYIETSLSSSNFKRIHKSYIIPISKIALIQNNFLMLKNCGDQIPIGKTYKTDLLNLVNHKLLSDGNNYKFDC
ncbi:LytR/AlgR family response regulator transcription factor [Niabella beijingensis]|uniref:LytR/AlgR family response regulator transcription factor n=1 Tax=Niabella beijingensis TaxID=2872700 RepID=UPI001CBE9A93|nr:LytTR family DNA-binding domain-containing protein [Niabella beijingensis]MBZ4188965.1 LytTR family DNA-binding domain-containing protein [Niabella beijingensis]